VLLEEELVAGSKSQLVWEEEEEDLLVWVEALWREGSLRRREPGLERAELPKLLRREERRLWLFALG